MLDRAQFLGITKHADDGACPLQWTSLTVGSQVASKPMTYQRLAPQILPLARCKGNRNRRFSKGLSRHILSRQGLPAVFHGALTKSPTAIVPIASTLYPELRIGCAQKISISSFYGLTMKKTDENRIVGRVYLELGGCSAIESD